MSRKDLNYDMLVILNLLTYKLNILKFKIIKDAG